MKKWQRCLLFWSALILALIGFIFLNNGPLFVTRPTIKPFLVANGGVSQPFSAVGLTNQTCTAARMLPATHSYLENTIASMKAAFQDGADIVEFDVQMTSDRQFAVFHDSTLECRTDGKGSIRDHTLAELKKLDIGYGYTADGGKTFPFRGKGLALMPSLDEVLQAFPDRELLIDEKNNDPEEGVQLAHVLAVLPADRLKLLTVYGGDEPIETLHQRLPSIRVMSKAILKNCLLQYEAIGWTGYVPSACEHIELHIPDKIASWLWGWPTRFLDRMAASDTRVVLVIGDINSGFSSGFDTAEDLQRLPDHYAGGIWTNRIDSIGPLYRNK